MLFVQSVMLGFHRNKQLKKYYNFDQSKILVGFKVKKKKTVNVPSIELQCLSPPQNYDVQKTKKALWKASTSSN